MRALAIVYEPDAGPGVFADEPIGHHLATSRSNSGARSRRRWHGRLARGRLHLLARSRHRLGRRRSRGPGRGAQGAARLLQRIGRANHRLDEPSRAVMVPASRFEVLECMAAEDALAEHTLDGGADLPGGLEVLAQHITGVACAGPFEADAALRGGALTRHPSLISPVQISTPCSVRRDRRLCAATYERYRRLEAGRGRALAAAATRSCAPVPDECRHHRRGTVDPDPARAGKRLGEVEECFVSMLTPGDTFLFAGQLLAFPSIRDGEAMVAQRRPCATPRCQLMPA